MLRQLAAPTTARRDAGVPWPERGVSPAIVNFTTVNGVTDTELTIWGIGITQNMDAAASTLYLGYRHMEADITCTGAAAGGGGCAGAAGGPAKKLDTEDIHVIAGGAVVRF